MSKLRRQPLTKERARKIGMSFRHMYVLSVLMELEYMEHCDVNLKHPTIHQKLSRIKSDLQDVQKHHALVLDGKDVETILEPIHHLNEVIKVLLELEPNQIEAFSQGLSKMINDGK
jgi:hypothetical protein